MFNQLSDQEMLELKRNRSLGQPYLLLFVMVILKPKFSSRNLDLHRIAGNKRLFGKVLEHHYVSTKLSLSHCYFWQ